MSSDTAAHSSLQDPLRHDQALPVVEIFSTIQGEGFHTGKAASFLRLAGCDLACNWCDSKTSWNSNHWPRLDVSTIIERLSGSSLRDVIVSGGEPMCYNLTVLCNELKKNGFSTYLETSGAYPLTGTWNWICLSPKPQSPPRTEFYSVANELKVVIETPDDVEWAEKQSALVSDSCLRYLQPEWSVRKSMVPFMVEYILKNPHWMLSLQSHKYIGIP